MEMTSAGSQPSDTGHGLCAPVQNSRIEFRSSGLVAITHQAISLDQHHCVDEIGQFSTRLLVP